MTQALPSLVYHFDEPFGDPVGFPTYLVSKFTKEHVTVCLSREGGDEIFGGYRRYVAENLFNRYPVLVALLNNKILHTPFVKLSFSDWWQRFIEASGIRDKVERHVSWLFIFNKEMRAGLFGGHLKQSPDFDPLSIYRSLQSLLQNSFKPARNWRESSLS